MPDRVLNISLELLKHDLFAYVFVWDSLTKLQFLYNEMSLLDIKIILNVLAIIKLKGIKYLTENSEKIPDAGTFYIAA